MGLGLRLAHRLLNANCLVRDPYIVKAELVNEAGAGKKVIVTDSNHHRATIACGAPRIIGFQVSNDESGAVNNVVTRKRLAASCKQAMQNMHRLHSTRLRPYEGLAVGLGQVARRLRFTANLEDN